MKLAFHYHTPLAVVDGRMCLPGYMGLFVDAVASEVDELHLILHEAEGAGVENADYVLQGENISWTSLGKKTPAWHRSLRNRSILKPLKTIGSEVDVLLLRSPSPLAPFFSRVDSMRGKIAYMVVSDYGIGANFVAGNGIRSRLVRAYSRWIDYLFKRCLANQLVIANSREIYETLSPLTPFIHEVKTTTLSDGDFYEREDTCLGEPIRLLFTGRIVMDKGLREIVQATARLVAEGIPVESHFVGWEDDRRNPVQTELSRVGEELGIQARLKFHGRKQVGPELNEMYRMSDIYVLPSYHEGFPRTIWEAMANGLPVVASKVGSIPAYLNHGEDSLLIEPRDASGLAEQLKVVIKDRDLRIRIIRNGLELARQNTLERQARRLVRVLESHDWGVD